ncbi:MAG: LysR family transcriptional regulator [Clostridia bacterium]|nr:LysR family transcriptional regulator [Clostridia bacterium]
MTIQQITYVVKVAETKSINSAAAELYISQPALSGAIRNLERELHTKIFVRSNTGIKTTPEGDEFLAYARIICSVLCDIKERFYN